LASSPGTSFSSDFDFAIVFSRLLVTDIFIFFLADDSAAGWRSSALADRKWNWHVCWRSPFIVVLFAISSHRAPVKRIKGRRTTQVLGAGRPLDCYLDVTDVFLYDRFSAIRGQSTIGHLGGRVIVKYLSSGTTDALKAVAATFAAVLAVMLMEALSFYDARSATVNSCVKLDVVMVSADVVVVFEVEMVMIVSRTSTPLEFLAIPSLTTAARTARRLVIEAKLSCGGAICHGA
jgi:hypothetical protein